MAHEIEKARNALNKAEDYLNRGFVSLAVSTLKKALKKYILLDNEAAFMLGEIYSKEGEFYDPETALEYYSKIHSTGFEHYDLSRVKMADICYNLGDFENAAKYYTELAEKEDIHALSRLARLYEEGIGVSKDTDNAIRLYEKLFKNGDENAAYNLGRLYKKSINTIMLAEEYLQKAADAGNNDAKALLDTLFDEIPTEELHTFQQQQKEISYEKYAKPRIKCLEELAKRGERSVYYTLGYAHKHNENHDEAKKWLLKAAEDNNKSALYSLSFYGDFNEKEMYAIKALEEGHNKALSRLGSIYYGAKMWDKSQEFFTKASQNGDAFGFFGLGKLYSNEDFPEYNIETALKYYEKAFDMGNIKAGVELCKMHMEKLNAPETAAPYLEKLAGLGKCPYDFMSLYRIYYDLGDFEKAFYWCNNAPKSSESEKFYSLAILYKDGKGTDTDYQKAKENLEKSITYYDCADEKNKIELIKLCLRCDDKSIRDLRRVASLLNHNDLGDMGEDFKKELYKTAIDDIFSENDTKTAYITLSEMFLNGDIFDANSGMAFYYILKAMNIDLDKVTSFTSPEYDAETEKDYLKGLAIEKSGQDYNEAAKLYRYAAQKNHIDAMRRLAKVLDITSQSADNAEAAFWKNKAKAMGDPYLNNNKLYLAFLGTNGDADAIYQLAYIAQYKDKEDISIVKILTLIAASIYRKMSNNGDCDADYILYKLYSFGVLEDEAMSVHFAKRAITSGHGLMLYAATSEDFPLSYNREERSALALKALKTGVMRAQSALDLIRAERIYETKLRAEILEMQENERRLNGMDLASQLYKYENELDLKEMMRNLVWDGYTFTDVQRLFLGRMDTAEFMFNNSRRQKKIDAKRKEIEAELKNMNKD